MATFGTFTVGQVLTAAELNAAGAWTTFTPSWSNLTVGNATQEFKYSIFNKIMFIRGRLTFGTTTTMGTAPAFTIPASASAVAVSVGQAYQFDQSAGVINVATVRASGTAITLFASDSSTTYLSRVNTTATIPFTWATSDDLTFTIVLEIA